MIYMPDMHSLQLRKKTSEKLPRVKIHIPKNVTPK